MDKAIIRFFAVQMYEPFIEDIKPLQEDNEIKRYLEQLTRESVFPIMLPANFEMIVHKNIVIRGKDLSPKKLKDSVVLDSVWVNWNRVKSEINSALRNDIYLKKEISQRITNKQKFLADEKEKAINETALDQHIDLQAEFVVNLLDKSFPLIEKYFRLDEYGLPSLRFMELFLNRIIGEQLTIKGSKVERFIAAFKVGSDTYTINMGPQFNRIFDKYSLLKDYEIHYLRRKLTELNPNVNLSDEMQKDGYDKHKNMLEKIIKLQEPVFYVSFDLDIKKTHLKKQEGFIKEFSNYKESFEGSIAKKVRRKMKAEERLKTYSTVIEHIDRYFDLRFNRKKTYQQIQTELGQANFNVVWRDIQELADKLGFTEENKRIDDENP